MLARSSATLHTSSFRRRSKRRAHERALRDLLASAEAWNSELVRSTAIRSEVVVAGVLAILDAEIGQSEAQVSHYQLPTVVYDPLQSLRAFQKLIGNALKYRRRTE